MKPLRVAFIINSLQGGGAERVASILLAEFAGPLGAEYGLDVRLVLLDDLPHSYPIPPSIPTHVVGAQGRLLRSALGIRPILGAIAPDVCLSFLSRANLATVLNRIGRRAPVIVSERVNTSGHFAAPGLRNRLSKMMIRALYPRANRVLAVSEGVAEDLALNYGVPRRKLVVIHNPFDLKAIAEGGAAEPAPGTIPHGPYLAAMGRLTTVKNFSMLLEAYVAADPAVDLVVLGEGEERAALQARAQALGIGGRVHFPGHLANPHAVVARAVGFVSASNAEGFPNAAAEAMALGRPVALTDCPSGPSELLIGRAPPGAGVVRARHGLLTPVGDRDALAAAIRTLLTPSAAAELGAAAQARMGAFEASKIARRYAEEIVAVARGG